MQRESDQREKEKNYLISATIAHFPFTGVDIAPLPRYCSHSAVDRRRSFDFIWYKVATEKSRGRWKRLYAVPSEKLWVRIVWLTGVVADEWHKRLHWSDCEDSRASSNGHERYLGRHEDRIRCK